MAQQPFDYDRITESWDAFENIPDRYNLGQALTAGNVAQGRGDHVALFWENTDGKKRSFTYAQLDELTNRLASALTQIGLQPGQRVFLRLPNIPEFYIAALAVAKAGGVFIPSSTLFRAEEIEYRFKDSQAVACITTTALVDPVSEAAADVPGVKHIITVNYGGGESPAGAKGFDQLIQNGDLHFTSVDTAADDIAFMAYTSGTTGDPKGVVHFHRYPISYRGLVTYWHDYQPPDVVACPPEVGWVLPVASSFLYAFQAGCSVVLYHETSGAFDPQHWFDLIDRYKISNFVGTPTIFRMFLKAADLRTAHDLSSWRHAVSAGEPLPPDTFESVRDIFGITVLDGLGMSECMVYAHNMVGMDIRPGSCGKPSPGLEITVRNEELNPVPDGEEGILCIRRAGHPGMMKNYWNKPEQTAEVFRDEWYVSGDVVVRDPDGYLWFKGRADDVIKASGYRISPFEVESALASHPAVLESAAVPSPDEMRGNVVKAFVVLRPGQTATAEEIQAHVKNAIAPFKYPRKIEFVDELPKTQSGKIKRRILRQREFQQ
jgi:acyl-coenzyme A synthetase/AMP-(fatty) acid ligase